MACFLLVLLQGGAVLPACGHARMLLSIRLTDSEAANVSASQVCMDEHKHVQHIDARLTLCTVPGQSR